MKNITKVLSVLLSIALLFSLLTVNIFAQSEKTEKELYLEDTDEHICSTCFDYDDETIISDVLETNGLQLDTEYVGLPVDNVELIYSDADEIKENILSSDVFSIDGFVSVNKELVDIND